MAQFPIENPDKPKTSGDGNFLNLNQEEYNHFYDSTTPRCKGFLVDRPPHDSLYFLSQLKAVGNYYKNVSGGKLLFTADIITNPNSPENGYYTVSDSMEYYAKADTSLAKLFSEALNTAKADIEEYFDGKPFSPDDVVFVVFHAGLGQDISYPYLDPTVYDLKSAYLEESMFKDKNKTTIKSTHILVSFIVYLTITLKIFLPSTPLYHVFLFNRLGIWNSEIFLRTHP